MKVFTKESLVAELKDIYNGGWIPSCKPPKNHGAVGNTLEQLLGITENNLPLPNAAEWELKGQRRKAPTRTPRRASARQVSSLLTLFHMEPSPQGMSLVNTLLIDKYGWPLEGNPNETSFRQTISTLAPSDRGFQVIVNEAEKKVMISFNAKSVGAKHHNWLKTVENRIGLEQLNPQPYWGFDDLIHKAGTKLKNTFYILADSKVQGDIEYFKYNGIVMLQTFSGQKFIEAIKAGIVKVDFDARNGFERDGHNHGTKYRIDASFIPSLYETVKTILDAPLNYSERLKTIDLTAVRTISEIEKAASEGPTIIQMTFDE